MGSSDAVSSMDFGCRGFTRIGNVCPSVVALASRSCVAACPENSKIRHESNCSLRATARSTPFIFGRITSTIIRSGDDSATISIAASKLYADRAPYLADEKITTQYRLRAARHPQSRLLAARPAKQVVSRRSGRCDAAGAHQLSLRFPHSELALYQTRLNAVSARHNQQAVTDLRFT